MWKEGHSESEHFCHLGNICGPTTAPRDHRETNGKTALHNPEKKSLDS